ncbi:hypothetical protein C3488_13960 [Streptomyces sp. Ru72]|nr:hypothetical protein C3488_13960 [Streptomyces sp. Ru72]
MELRFIQVQRIEGDAGTRPHCRSSQLSPETLCDLPRTERVPVVLMDGSANSYWISPSMSHTPVHPGADRSADGPGIVGA